MQTLFSDPDNEMGLQNRLLSEAGAMAEAALSRGKDVPPKVITDIEAAKKARSGEQPVPDDLLANLVSAHHTLARLIAPATPRTMMLLQVEGRSSNAFLRLLGPISLVRHLMLAAAVSLLAFIAMCYTPYTNPDQGAYKSFLSLDGWQLLANIILYLSSAGLGASFLCLYKANRYVTEGTFDPMFEGSYWIRFFLGLISGLMLSVLVNEDALKEVKLLEPGIARVMFALLGGFSAELFYTFLSRFVEALKSLFHGSADELVKTQVAREKARLAAAQLSEQMQQAAALMRLQQSIGGSTTPDEMKRQLSELMNQILLPQGLSPASPAPRPTAPPSPPATPNPAPPATPAGS
ncbi:MAG: hypothetical protein HZA93_27510 [Verrucomicrobia bacterium]|nr:hypothetical protein [Verrucomicrobiota bacterium]